MRLPNAKRAFVDLQKLRDYCLNLEHPRGKHKAWVFAEVLGMTSDDAESLREFLLEAVLQEEAIPGEGDSYGQRYRVDMSIKWNERQAMVRTSWIIRVDEDFPRLTSCYVL